MSGISVTGGAAGLSVGLDELEESAGRLRRIALDVGEVGLAIGLAAVDPGLALAGLLAPVEAVTAELAIGRCTGVVAVGVEVGTTAAATTAAVHAYRDGERSVQALTDGIATSAGAWVGRSVAPVVLGAGLASVPVVAAVMTVPGARAAAISIGLGLGQEADEILFDHPWLVPAAADGLDGLLLGLGEGVPVLGLWLGWRSGRAGVPYPPRDHAGALAVVVAATKGAVLDESGRRVDLRPRPAGVGRAPRGVADLVAADGPTSGGSRLRVTGIPQADGTWAWVVDIPGTQTFDPRAGANPWDLTSNALLLAGETTASMLAVERAVTDARRRVGDTGPPRVMAAGHSHGGITAAALAANPHLRRRLGITHVVTSGAPVASLGVPEDVSVLSLEHTEDLVPGLEGAANPDRAGWVTVERSLADDLGRDARATQAHDSGRYAETARLVDASEDPSLAEWRQGAAPFVGTAGTPTVTIDYDVERI